MLGKLNSWFGQATPQAKPHNTPWDGPWTASATEDDIFHCFRLLLGRRPHREEWPGHVMRAGESLESIVAGYLGSLEFANRGLLDRRGPQAIRLVGIEGCRIYVDASDPDVGRHVEANNYEQDVTAVFRRLLRPGMGVIDVGANIGYFTMLSATLVGAEGHVLAVEPNPRNLRLLEASRRLNGFAQVTVAQVAAGRETGLLVLHAAQSNGTTSMPPDGFDALLTAETVPSLRLDDLASSGRRIDLIKVDVEGAEYNALLGGRGIIARDRPSIISEFSPDLMPGISGIGGTDYLRWLVGLGYRIGVVQPDGSVSPPGQDPEPVMAEYQARGQDHLDILATPG